MKQVRKAHTASNSFDTVRAVGLALPGVEATIKKEPNRFRGLYGGALAAEGAGQRARAIALYKQLLQVASEPDTNRPELEHARALVK